MLGIKTLLLKWDADTRGIFFDRVSAGPRLGAAEQTGGGKAGSMALGPRILEEDRGAAGCRASERGTGHARLETAQFRGAASGKRRNEVNAEEVVEMTCPQSCGLEAEKMR